MGWAHPRSRGENTWRMAALTAWSGSSPLTRGKQARCGDVPCGEGLIPAHAGKTSRHCGRNPKGRAHPRSRGENIGPIISQVGDVGSSPLTRGKPERQTPMTERSRLIPAHAGKTGPRRAVSGALWAHPRSRGENRDRPRRGRERQGSSPLTRGKPVFWRYRGETEGLIPAHAGKTLHAGDRGRARRAHPRSRGENGR